MTSTSATADVESAASQSQNLRRRRSIELAAILVLVIVFDAVKITVLDLTIFKIRTPNYGLKTISIENLTVNNSTNSPSFAMEFDAEISFRNRNFGPYEFNFGYLTFSYRGTRVGNAVVKGSTVKMHSRKSFNHKVKLNSQSVGEKSKLQRDIAKGEIVLEVESELRGQVDLMKIYILRYDKSSEIELQFDC